MIPHRFGRLFGAVLLLAPSLAFGQTALQQPCTDRTRGCTVQPVPASVDALYANDVYLQGLIGTRFGQLGAAAFLNVGMVAGTVADGGALTAETIRAQAAEQANATAIGLRAPLASPALTGVPTAPTAPVGTNTTQVATTAFVLANASGGSSGGVPPSRQILTSGLATGGGDLTADRTIAVPVAAQSDVASGIDNTKALTSFAVSARFALLAPLASPALTGTPTAPTAAAGTNSTQIATTGFVAGSYAPLASPALTGAPTAPTQSAADSSTKIATTAYADRSAGNAVAPAPALPSASATLPATSGVDQYATGTITLTAPNGGAGWRSGTVLNANTVTGLVTLAVPSGATLDGASNGTTGLYPFQRARIIQTGATAYITDWIDRSPLIATLAPTTALASADVNLPVGYTKFRVSISGINLGTAGAYLGLRFGDSGGVKTGASDYNSLSWNNAAVTNTVGTYGEIARSVAGGAATFKPIAPMVVFPGASGQYPNAVVQAYRFDNSGNRIIEQIGIDYVGTTSGAMGRANLLRFIASTGTATFNATVYGEP